MLTRHQRGYGDFGGLGSYTDFGNMGGGGGGGGMDEAEPPQQEQPKPLGRAFAGGMGGGGGGMPMGGAAMNTEFRQEIFYLKQDNQIIKNAVMELEKDRDNLRQAIRKLKVENSRIKLKLKKMGEKNGDMMDIGDDDMDFDEVKDYILIGGPQDPLSLRFEATIRDGAGLEHKTAERYYWYKMAEHFKQTSTAEEIRTAANTLKAEEIMKTIKDFDETSWATVKMQFWEEGQRMKCDQVRWIQNLLIYTDKAYLAIGSQDKLFGTGWRKNRAEAWSPKYWDGENGGGKALMRLREHFKQNHAWMGPYEEQETEKKFKELKATAWRRDRRDQFGNRMRGGGFAGGGFAGKRGASNAVGRGGSFPQKRTRQFF